VSAAAIAALDEINGAPERAPVPILDEAAYHGLVGEFVRLISPFTEASPAAVLACALTAIGALLNRGPRWRIGSDEHHTRLFVLLVGPTGSGRKGTAIGWGVRNLLKSLDPDFYRAKVVSGLSSAEGLIAEIRDATPDSVGSNGKPVAGDGGVVDKRLLVIEDEFSGPLQAMAREGNRLSPVLRDAWDGRDLGSMVKKDRQRATEPHICIVGSITAEELAVQLKATAVRNGLANRFLPIFTARARLLALNPEAPKAEVEVVCTKLRAAVDTARRINYVKWSPAAEDRWVEVYPGLAVPSDATSVVRALVERGAPYVHRLAMLYAVLDGTGEVQLSHLDAALALWRYAEGTWRLVYADSTPLTPLATRLLKAIEAAGAAGSSRTSLREAAGSNDIPAGLITQELNGLAAAGLVHREQVRTPGRSKEVWRHARHVGAPMTANDDTAACDQALVA
jgi:hypothetical protein